MGSQKMINLINEYGEINRVELLCAFEIENNSKYIIYTKNEKTEERYCIIYGGKIIETEEGQQLENIKDGKDWENFKNILKQMSKYSIEGENND